jgi:hypothetical protein
MLKTADRWTFVWAKKVLPINLKRGFKSKVPTRFQYSYMRHEETVKLIAQQFQYFG